MAMHRETTMGGLGNVETNRSVKSQFYMDDARWSINNVPVSKSPLGEAKFEKLDITTPPAEVGYISIR